MPPNNVGWVWLITGCSAVARNGDILKRLVPEAKRDERDTEHCIYISMAYTYKYAEWGVVHVNARVLYSPVSVRDILSPWLSVARMSDNTSMTLMGNVPSRRDSTSTGAPTVPTKAAAEANDDSTLCFGLIGLLDSPVRSRWPKAATVIDHCHSGRFLVVATNHIERLDPALKRLRMTQYEPVLLWGSKSGKFDEI
ncbi:hypothetical protein V8E53_010678 [Lactarius tabidus]